MSATIEFRREEALGAGDEAKAVLLVFLEEIRAQLGASGAAVDEALGDFQDAKVEQKLRETKP